MLHHGGIKRENIAELMTRARKAYDEEYYLEATWIYYSLIDDRLTAIFHHLGKESEVMHSNNRAINFKPRIEKLERDVDAESPSYVLDSQLSKDDLKKLIKDVFDWAQTRNDFMHKLADKEGTYDDYENEVKQLAEQGRELHKEFTNYVQRLKNRAPKR